MILQEYLQFYIHIFYKIGHVYLLGNGRNKTTAERRKQKTKIDKSTCNDDISVI